MQQESSGFELGLSVLQLHVNNNNNNNNNKNSNFNLYSAFEETQGRFTE